MKRSGLLKSSRILLFLSGVILLFIVKVPIWRIELNAPQYPEGLALTIHADGIKGDVEIINGLNHYIGMKTLHNKDFFEFTALPYLIVAFSVLFILSAVINKKSALFFSLFSFIFFGIVAMIDFYRWEFNYGHDLNPDAAIKVPGMSYQPPLIGYKQLLNFGAYSIPDIGGCLFIAAGIIILSITIHEIKRK